MILRAAVVVNILFTVGAIIFSIWLQQMAPMAVRASAFKTFQEKVTDEERDHILNSAAEVVFWSIRALVVTSVIWIAIGIGMMIRKTPAATQLK